MMLPTLPATLTPPNAQPTLNPTPLAAWRVRTQERAPNFMGELIDIFCTDTTTQLGLIERAIEAGDTVACRARAHRLHGGSLAVGAVRLASLFESMELLSKAGAVAFLGELLAEIRVEYGRLEAALQQER